MRCVVVTALASICFLLGGCEPKPAELRLVKPLANSADLDIAKDFLELLDRESKVSIEFTTEAMSELDAIEALIAGDADIAMVSNSLPFRRRVSTVLSLYPTVLHIGYRSDRVSTDGRSIFHGANVYAGPPGSASRLMFDSVRQRFDLAAEDFAYIDGRAETQQDGTFPDVFVVFAPIARNNLENIPDDIRSDIRLVTMGEPADIGTGGPIDSATLLNPHLEPFIIPEGTYGELPEDPVLTLSVDMLLVARTDLDEAVVYDLVQEVLRLKPALSSLRPGLFQRITDHFDSGNSTFVLHPGLVAYEQRDAPTLMERYSGVAEVVVTLFVAVVSAMFAATRMYKVRRKNRIDIFYSKILEIRRRTDDATAEQRAAAIAELKALQTTAFEQLIDERLAADDSFRIFISLSNDVIDELDAASASA